MSAWRLARPLVAWFGGLSISWILCCIAVVITVYILRRKGYAVRLGVGCIIFRAVPGSRRFPQGIDLCVSTRLVGFIFGGCRGPWLDVTSDRICMRLRGDGRPRKWVREYRSLSQKLSLDRGYWRTLRNNIVSRLAALIIRGLRVRATKVRIWKDGADWEFSGDTLVMAGCAEGVFGSKYTLSLNELSFRTLAPVSRAPMRVECTRGVEITARLSARFFGLLRARRIALIDDLRIAVDAHDLSLDAASGALRATLKAAEIDLSPRHSRSLRARLPASLAFQDRTSGGGLIRSWEARAELSSASLRFAPPPRPAPLFASSFAKEELPTHRGVEWAAEALRSHPQKYAAWLHARTRASAAPPAGVFFRLDRLHSEAYGVMQNERGDPVVHASVQLRGCSAGSLAVDELSRDLYERSALGGVDAGVGDTANNLNSPTVAVHRSVRQSLRYGRLRRRNNRRRDEAEAKAQSKRLAEERLRRPPVADHLEKIVAARPEAMFWIDDISAAIDANMRRSHACKLEVAASGIVAALEPVGLASLFADAIAFVAAQFPQKVAGDTGEEFGHQEDHINRGSSSSLASDGVSSMIRSASSSSLGSVDGEPRLFQFVVQLRHCRVILLGHGPVGDGDTVALIASAESLSIPSLDSIANRGVRYSAEAANLKLLHWTQWARTTNVVCKSARLETTDAVPSAVPEKLVTISALDIDWDVDLQASFAAVPHMLAILKHCFKRYESTRDQLSSLRSPEIALSCSIPLTDGASIGGACNVEADPPFSKEEQEHRDKIILLTRKIAGWNITGEKMSVAVSFPDGPRLALSVGVLPQSALSATKYFGRDVVLTLCEVPTVYVETLLLRNPLFTIGRSVRRPRIDIEGSGFRAVLGHTVELGSLLQDWLIRFRAVVKLYREERYMRKGVKAPPRYRIPTPDIYFRGRDIALFLEDHPLAAFLTNMLPLYQHESRERMRRHSMFHRMKELSNIENFETSSYREFCSNRLNELDSKIWLDRVRKLKEDSKPYEMAKGFLPPLSGHPLAKLTADTLNFEMVMDDQTHQEGSKESIRKLMALDEYQLGPKRRKMNRQYDTDAWNTLGFRNVNFDITRLVLSLRDYPEPFLEMNHAYSNNTVIGQAAQATVSPYLAKTKVALGRRRVAKLVKSLSNTKTFADIHLMIDELTCRFNPAQLGVIGDYGRAISRFSSNGKNPSPRIPWFDTLRTNTHGRFRITAKALKGHLACSNSPYTKTTHFIDVCADDVLMVASRLKASKEEPFPISWTLHNWHIRPAKFHNKRQSDICFEYVRVGLTPVPECDDGDAQDHYFIPFPTKAEVKVGGPGIGRGTMDIINLSEPVMAKLNPFNCYTQWTSPLEENPEFDSYSGFKTRRMTLGIDICVRHHKSIQPGSGVETRRHRLQYIPKPPAVDYSAPDWTPDGASVVHSDALTTLIKVIKNLVRRPVSCRLAPRMIDHARKPASKTGLSSSLVALNVTMNVLDLNVMFYNNLQSGHGLFVSVAKFTGELGKETKITFDDDGSYNRDSKIARRRLEVQDLNSSIRMPDLDLVADDTGTGRLLSVARVFLSDDVKDESQYAASPRLKAPYRVLSTGFGTELNGKSPFYTYSASHPLQRDKKLDKVKHDVRIAVDNVRLVWSPARRTSIWAWPDALKEKSFVMKAPPHPWGKAKDDDAEECGERTPALTGSRNEDAPTAIRELVQKSTAIRQADRGLSQKLSSTDSNGSDIDVDYSANALPSLPTRTASGYVRRPAGSMVDILNTEKNDENTAKECPVAPLSLNVNKTLETIPIREFLINNSQLCIGSPECAGLVLVTSDAARIGIVEKTIQQKHQIGGGNETWVDTEHRVHLKESNIYCRSTELDSFDFGARTWVPKDAPEKATDIPYLTRVTIKPVSMDLMYISSKSETKGNDDDREDYSLRPSLLFINLREISMASTSVEFQAVTDVVRRVLMQRVVSSSIVKEKLAKLRYGIQLNGQVGKNLDGLLARLSTITKQFLYAADTSQHELVHGLQVPETSFEESLQDYKAKLKAVATFIRTDQRASTTQLSYPTMYISYSFDKCSWELREIQESTGKTAAIVEMALCDLVCRHIFYVGRGSSAEITFKSIKANNRMNTSQIEEFLKPAGSHADMSRGKARSIKASDGSAVAFRWYSTQTDKVGGISVYDLLTIQLAPLNAAVSRRLYSAVSRFIFPTRGKSSDSGLTLENGKGSGAVSGASSARSSMDGRENRPTGEIADSLKHSNSMKEKISEGAFESDVTQMTQRGESTMLFKYVFIDAFELTASYKNKDKDRSMLDFSNLFVTTPSFSYSSEVWTWKDFAVRIRKDLVFTFARRGVSNLAKIKLLPGYNRAKRKLRQGAENVTKSIAGRLHASPDRDRMETNDDIDSDNNGSDRDTGSDSSLAEREDYVQQSIDITEQESSGEEHRKYVLRALYGERSLDLVVDSSKLQTSSSSGSSGKPANISFYSDRSTPAPGADAIASHRASNAISRPYRGASFNSAATSRDSAASSDRGAKPGLWGRLRRR